jgi:hypothetical protein
MDLLTHGAPGRIRTSDPQIRSLGLRIENKREFFKPAWEWATEGQWLSGRLANRGGSIYDGYGNLDQFQAESATVRAHGELRAWEFPGSS